MAKVKIQITVEEELLSRVDEYADEHYTSRSGAFALAADQLVSADEMKKVVKRVSLAMEGMAKGKELTKDQQEDLERFRVLSALWV